MKVVGPASTPYAARARPTRDCRKWPRHARASHPTARSPAEMVRATLLTRRGALPTFLAVAPREEAVVEGGGGAKHGLVVSAAHEWRTREGGGVECGLVVSAVSTPNNSPRNGIIPTGSSPPLWCIQPRLSTPQNRLHAAPSSPSLSVQLPLPLSPSSERPYRVKPCTRR